MAINCLQFALALTFSLLAVCVTAYDNVRRDKTNVANTSPDYFDVGLRMKINKHDKISSIDDLEIDEDDKVTNDLEYILKSIVQNQIMEELASELGDVKQEQIKGLAFEIEDSDISDNVKHSPLKLGKKLKDKRKSKHRRPGKVFNSKLGLPVLVSAFARILHKSVTTFMRVIGKRGSAVSKFLRPSKAHGKRPPKLPRKKHKPRYKPKKPKSKRPEYEMPDAGPDDEDPPGPGHNQDYYDDEE